MSEAMREKFEIHYRTVNHRASFAIDQEGNYQNDDVFAAFTHYEVGYQAAASHYEQQIDELKEDLQDLRTQTNYRCADVQRFQIERDSLLALVALKDEALQIALDISSCDVELANAADKISYALHKQPDSCRLVEVATIEPGYSVKNDMYYPEGENHAIDDGNLDIDTLPHGTKLYFIETIKDSGSENDTVD